MKKIHYYHRYKLKNNILRNKFLIISIGVILSLNSCYVLNQGWGQLEILRKRRPIHEVIHDSKTSNYVKERLLFIEKVRRFAEFKMGLSVNKTFTTYSQLNRNVLAWNIVAVKELSFKKKTWYFPIVGTVPYLGFFDYESVKAKALELKKAGWDIKINAIAAYSSLNWFEDPLISTQLKYSYSFLANLLIHECTHATLWIKDHVSFNESLASFIGRQGAVDYFRREKDIKNLQLIQASLSRTKIKKRIYSYYNRRLQSVYSSKLSIVQKKLKKQKLFTELENKLISVGLRTAKEKKETPLNNAHLSSFTHYNIGGSYFLREFKKCKKDWNCFLKKMTKLGALSKKDRIKAWQRR